MKFKMVIPILLLAGCTSSQINQTLGELNKTVGEESLTREEVASGLKEALVVGISKGSDLASKTDGYFKNPTIKIPFPPDVKEVETKLRDIGLGNQVDRFILTLNRGAEKAAAEAKPIFVTAIREMTIQDAWGILKGEDDAATEYLKEKTSNQLYAKFKPVISDALDEVNATKYYSDLITTYNKIPFVTKVNPDLEDYATKEAMNGLFYLIENEEQKIRQDPVARTTDLLKKVFAAQD